MVSFKEEDDGATTDRRPLSVAIPISIGANGGNICHGLNGLTDWGNQDNFLLRPIR
jgi:hypothetical protein